MSLSVAIADGAEVYIDESWHRAKSININADKNSMISLLRPINIDTINTAIYLDVKNGGSVTISKNCYVGILNVACDSGFVNIGEGTTINMANFRAFEGKSINIGHDCMLGGEIEIDTSDFHAMYDLDTGQVLNHGKDVVIGDHVWIANSCHILKGSRIGRGSIIGARSLVTGEIPEECVAAGVPARVIRSRVGWSRASPENLPREV